MIQLSLILDFRIELQSWAALNDIGGQFKFSEQSGN